MILTVCLNPTFQSTMLFESFTLGEVNRCFEHYLDASGKGMNTARIVSQLGEESALLTHLGGPRKEEMLALCSKDAVEVIHTDSSSAIRTCTTIIAQGVCTELVQNPEAVGQGCEAAIRTLFSEAIQRAEALIICGTRAPGYSKGLYSDFVKEAKERGKFVLLDIKGDDLLSCLPHRPDVIKPNFSEFVATFFGEKVPEQGQNTYLLKRVLMKMAELQDKYGCKSVISRGKHALLVFDHGPTSVEIEPTEVVNSIGCGDTLSASLTVALLQGHSLQQASLTATKHATMQAKTIHPGSLV
ncbi:MAG: PfkB family carbohydrate kinase [Sphaerochaeta sp.]|nr:PfkB family carbohydrate kinase [Sphaerochaeta sp.]